MNGVNIFDKKNMAMICFYDQQERYNISNNLHKQKEKKSNKLPIMGYLFEIHLNYICPFRNFRKYMNVIEIHSKFLHNI